MDEPQNSDEELLAMLQPPKMPTEFVFESALPMTADTSDDDSNNEHLPGPAPPAPMALMAPMESIEQHVDLEEKDKAAASLHAPGFGVTNGSGNTQLSSGNGSKDQEDDEDEIAYENAKVVSRTPRSAKARSGRGPSSSNRKPRSKLNLSESSRSGSRDRPNSMPLSPEPKVQPKPESKSSKPPAFRFDIVINPLPSQVAREYQPIPPGDEIYRVLEKISTGVPGETWLSVEFEDGHIDQVPFDQLSSYPNGRQALAEYRKPKAMDDLEDETSLGFGGRPKRKTAPDPDYDFTGDPDEDVFDEDEEDEDDSGFLHPAKRRRLQRKRNAEAAGLRRRVRTRSALPSADEEDEDDEEEQDSDDDDDDDDIDTHRKGRFNLRGNPGKSRRSRHIMASGGNDADELGDGDDDFFIVKSDITPHKTPRRRGGHAVKHGHGRLKLYQDKDDIEFEAPRRSGRATKSTKTMADPAWDEDMYAPEEEKLPAAPRVSGAKEIFPPTPEGLFKDSHSTTCGTCGGNDRAPNKGIFVYCQGCSMGYHKVCLGFRSTRDHLVTKVGSNHFVLQCRDCVGVKKKKDNRSPSLDVCQVCKIKGRACEAFAPKRTANAEAKLREENGGEDPITPVDDSLINNPDNVLFRCVNCHCAYHFEHLPPAGVKRVEGTVRADRLDEYSIDWKCKDCLDMRFKISTLVAWRPVNRDTYVSGQTVLDLQEDDKEYLIKWESKSYAHCEWKPGPWVYGVTNAAMRNAFPKRNEGANLLPKFDAKDAIPEEYLLADVVLNVRFKGHFQFESKKDDIRKTYLIDQALIKFQGLDYADAVWDEPPELDSGHRWIAFVTAYSEFLNGKHFKSEPAANIKDRLRKFRELDFHKEVEFKDGTNGKQEQPRALTGTLMKYQIQGTNWLLHNFWQQVSVVLADDMGLGKTIQVISLISALALQGPRCWPFLVVVPNSTCPNWRREIKQWAPDLRVVTYHGGKEPQRLAYKYELFPNGSKEMKAHVVIMSYDSAQDPETRLLFKSIQWVGLVVDEGQRLKNDENLLYGALRAMKIPWRLLLTGTPLQNNKRELFNLLQFIDPSKNAAKLDEQYEEVTAEKIRELHAMIQPFFLRRTKAKTLKFLPPMAQIILPVSMSIVQEKLCKSIMAKKPELIRAIFANSKLKSSERGSLNNILIQLRKCLGHPFLYSGAVEDKNVDAETMHRNLVSASSKLVLLEQMLPKLRAQGHRVLLFSQFLGMLDIVEDFLSGMNLKYQRLDGSISSLEKQKRIDAFNEPGSEDFAFLLSTRAGGVGINLATADTVIILDPDFNPHQDLQALSRAHRIGQKNKVLCFQLMTKGSVEEKIMQIGRKKMALDHALIETMDREEDQPVDDLETILKHGAEALFSGNDKEAIKYDAEAIDKLLDRSQIEDNKTSDDDQGGSEEKQFAYAKVWENKTGGLADNIEAEETPQLSVSVWDKILKEREDEAKRLAKLNKEVLGRGGRRRQAVKYSGTAIPDLEDPVENAAENPEGSDVDEDFISSDSSDDDSDEDDATDTTGNSPRKQASKDQDPANFNPDTTQHSGDPTENRRRGRPRQYLFGDQDEQRAGSNNSIRGADTPISGLYGTAGQAALKQHPQHNATSVASISSPVGPPNPRAGQPSYNRQSEAGAISVPSASSGSASAASYNRQPEHGATSVPSAYSGAASTATWGGQPAYNRQPEHGAVFVPSASSGAASAALARGATEQCSQQLQSGPNGLTFQPRFNTFLGRVVGPVGGQGRFIGQPGHPVFPQDGLWSLTRDPFSNVPPLPPRPPGANMQFSMGNPGLNHPADPSNFLPSQQQVPASKPKIPSPQATNIGPPMEPSQCTKCLLYHPATIRCPSLTTEGRIRLALDEVKKLSGGLPVATQRNRERLQQLLKLRKNERLGESGRPSPRAPQPRLQQQPQPRLSAPNEEGGSLHQETHQDNTQ